MSLSLTSLPEEILERILSLALEPSSPPPDVPPAILKAGFTRSHSAPFPVSAGRASPSSSSRPSNFKAFSRTPVHRYTLLLTCTLFARIGTPLLYSSVHLKSRPSCALLGKTLRRRPDLARSVRALRLDGLWGEAALLLRALHVPGARLACFDFCITADREDNDGRGSDLQQFCDGLGTLPALGTVHRLTIRKTADAYLTLTTPNTVLECLSRVIPVWRSLDTVRINFRLPSGPRPPSTAQAGTPRTEPAGMHTFVDALARAPGLRVLHAELPALWNTALLAIADNPALHAIHLHPAPPSASAHLFLAEARRHARLAALIERGTPCVPLERTGRAPLRDRLGDMPRAGSAHGRGRAHTTVGTSTPSPTRSPAHSPRSSVAFPGAPPAAAAPPPNTSALPSSSAGPSRRRTGRRQSKTSRRMSAV
ncbi:hypothetical protein PsYK624_085600 [Phanerochaete sordida]|uniref:Uncharacterized protein n=1 Tax=Phanerochaete sordida TaxID=48140 RepID=A0A9P3GCK1_9APHY|nr:hypothetical protein PsYK624_085600 [Phanerochaete sordida]